MHMWFFKNSQRSSFAATGFPSTAALVARHLADIPLRAVRGRFSRQADAKYNPVIWNLRAAELRWPGPVDEKQRPCNLFHCDSLLLCDTGNGGVNYINPKQINGWQPMKGCGKGFGNWTGSWVPKPQALMVFPWLRLDIQLEPNWSLMSFSLSVFLFSHIRPLASFETLLSSCFMSFSPDSFVLCHSSHFYLIKHTPGHNLRRIKLNFTAVWLRNKMFFFFLYLTAIIEHRPNNDVEVIKNLFLFVWSPSLAASL